MLSRMIWKLSILVAAFRRFAILAPVFAVVVLSHGNAGAQTKSPAKHDEGYLGSEACARCHAGIYQTFSKTAMGRSMSIAAPDALDHAPSPFTFTNDRLNRKFEVSLKDRKIYQSEDGLGADNSFHDEHPMAWVIGAGVNGFGLILRRENYLFLSSVVVLHQARNLGAFAGVRIRRPRLQPIDPARMHLLPQRTPQLCRFQ